MTSKRITLDLDSGQVAELDHLQAVTGLSIAALARASISLMRIYVEAMQRGQHVRIGDARIVLPICVKGER